MPWRWPSFSREPQFPTAKLRFYHLALQSSTGTPDQQLAIQSLMSPLMTPEHESVDAASENKQQVSTDLVDKEHNTVKHFVEQHITRTACDSDHMMQFMAYERYLQLTTDEQTQNTMSGRNKFYEQLRRQLPDNYHKQKRVAGEIIKNVYTKCRLAG